MTIRPTLVLTAHGSVDPRSSATTRAVAARIRELRPGLDVQLAFCEKSVPNLRDVLHQLSGPAVITPLLLASAYHARVDIPAIVAESGGDAIQADTLGEDPRLVEVLEQRLTELGPQCWGRGNSDTGVLIVAVGSSHTAANARTASLVDSLTGRHAAVRVAYATGPQPSVADGIAALRATGVRRIALAPWFIAPGRITDRVAALAARTGIPMAEPLGAHPLVAATVLDRFDQAITERRAA